MKDTVTIGDNIVDVKDAMNPEGVFCEGKRMREHSVKDILPLSGRLIPEFDRRQNIRDMFTRKPTLPKESSIAPETSSVKLEQTTHTTSQSILIPESPMNSFSSASTLSPTKTTIKAPLPEDESSPKSIAGSLGPSTTTKRSLSEKSNNRSMKRVKSGTTAPPISSSVKGQQSLKGFFKPKGVANNNTADIEKGATAEALELQSQPHSVEENDKKPTLSQTTDQLPEAHVAPSPGTFPQSATSSFTANESAESSPIPSHRKAVEDQDVVHDPIESKESWSKLFTKPRAPRCEGHGEPCITLVTKKSGMNCGRSFWMCPRPIGPTGAKEKNTQWRCQTFIWCSDWSSGDG